VSEKGKFGEKLDAMSMITFLISHCNRFILRKNASLIAMVSMLEQQPQNSS